MERMKARLRPKTANSPADNRTSEMVIWHVRESPFLASSASPTLPHSSNAPSTPTSRHKDFRRFENGTAYASLEVAGEADNLSLRTLLLRNGPHFRRRQAQSTSRRFGCAGNSGAATVPFVHQVLLTVCVKEIENSCRQNCRSVCCKLSRTVLQAGEKKRFSFRQGEGIEQIYQLDFI
jgi:hypothetical protein